MVEGSLMGEILFLAGLVILIEFGLEVAIPKQIRFYIKINNMDTVMGFRVKSEKGIYSKRYRILISSLSLFLILYFSVAKFALVAISGSAIIFFYGIFVTFSDLLLFRSEDRQN